jgi:hypothetical protein
MEVAALRLSPEDHAQCRKEAKFAPRYETKSAVAPIARLDLHMVMVKVRGRSG